MSRNQRITLVSLNRCKSWLNSKQVKCKTVSEDHLGGYSLFEVTVAPQGSLLAHVHHWEGETYYILEGKLLFQEGERRFTATAGACVNVPKGILRTFKNVGTQSARLLVIITPAWYGKFFEEWVNQQQRNPPCHLRLLRKA